MKDRLIVSLMLTDLLLGAVCLLLACFDPDAVVTDARESLLGLAALALLNYAVLRAARKLP